ncbi:MAG TPA: helix-turn-helix domain-containing protein [Niastella sp.]|uniref:winged helix-turn-helix transcriptional regulator n=1 Tax=Niastella sp. OAS944 TaxID=2664089 RepID=UPI002F0E9882|nr:DNA-binding HxlR family transcriptional regulator [Chitinophagaceae bacterium OAS944]
MKNSSEKKHFPSCSIRHILDRFGDKWSILIISILGHIGKQRFNELNQQIGDISQKMLTVTLRSLEADGLISRKLYPEIPPRVEYELTDLGRSLLPHIEQLALWAEQHMDCILKNREKYSQKKAS